MMISLLEFRSKVQSYYQKYSVYIEPVFKFIIAMIVFQFINSNIGYDERLKALPIVLALSLVSAFTPTAILVLLSALITSLHVFHASTILSLIILVILLIMYLMYLYFVPKLGFILILTPILFLLNIPYLLPILLGLFYTPIAIVASACGIVIVYLLRIITEVVNMQLGETIEDIIQIYTYVIESLVKNQEMILTMIIFSFIIMLIYIIRRQKFDYSPQVAIGIGTLASILCFLYADLKLEITEQIGPMIAGTIVSALIVLVIQFIYRPLDYSGAEHVQFEDEEYYYYVKAIPKIVVAEERLNIKRINVQRKSRDKDDTGEINRGTRTRNEKYADLKDNSKKENKYEDELYDDLFFEQLDDKK